MSNVANSRMRKNETAVRDIWFFFSVLCTKIQHTRCSLYVYLFIFFVFVFVKFVVSFDRMLNRSSMDVGIGEFLHSICWLFCVYIFVGVSNFCAIMML